MAIGERIRFIRNLRGMTQKLLGIAVGFSEKTADIRMAQYESGTRTPKSELTNALANVLEVSPMALEVPDIESCYGVIHTLFAMEDLYGLRIDSIDGKVCIRFEESSSTDSRKISKMLTAWQKESEKLKNGKITKEEYDHWRYTYPQVEAERARNALDEKRKQSQQQHKS